jgi:hypothetical protein
MLLISLGKYQLLPSSGQKYHFSIYETEAAGSYLGWYLSINLHCVAL